MEVSYPKSLHLSVHFALKRGEYCHVSLYLQTKELKVSRCGASWWRVQNASPARPLNRQHRQVGGVSFADELSPGHSNTVHHRHHQRGSVYGSTG